MITTPYSEDVINAHHKGSIYIDQINESLKGYSTALSLSQISKLEDSIKLKYTKDMLKDLLANIKKAETEWSKAITLNSFDSYLANLISQEKIESLEIRRFLNIFFSRLNHFANEPNLVITLDLETKPEEHYLEKYVIDKELIRIFERSYLNEEMKLVPIINVQNESDWDSSLFKDYIALSYKYGVPHFTNYTTGTIIKDHLHSLPDSMPRPTIMYLSHGGVLGNADNRGLIGCVLLNLPQAAYFSKDEDEFLDRVNAVADIAKNVLEEKRRLIELRLSSGYMPLTKTLHQSLDWHSSAIALVGMNEALLNLIGEGTANVAGKAITYKLLENMIKILEDYQSETGHLYTLAAYPSEWAGAYMAVIDHRNYANMLISGKQAPYYTCSTELPPNNGDDLWYAFEHQKKFHSIYNGANIFQIHLQKGMNYREEEKLLLRRCMNQFGFNSLKVSPVYSICRRDGYIPGEITKCPVCGGNVNTYVWVDGQALKLSTLPEGLKEAHRERVSYDVKNT